MAKKPVSVLLSRSPRKKPTKHITKTRKLKSVLKKIFNYLKSDTYMFAPLINPQSSPSISAGEVSFEAMKKKEKKLVEEIKEYLKCDAYMYSPLVMDGTPIHSLGDQRRGSVCDQAETRTKETSDDEHILTSSRNVDLGTPDNPMGRIALQHSLLQAERVKHIVHQNCRSLSATEELSSPKKPPRKVGRSEIAERAHTQVS